jgi:AraC family transcriptional regulator
VQCPKWLEGAVEKAIGFIERHYRNAITLGDMAAAACLSPYHFSRLFRRKTGLTPHQYLVRTRVEAVRRLIAGRHRSSLTDTATSVGFYDQSHLTRHFRRQFGTTPGRV